MAPIKRRRAALTVRQRSTTMRFTRPLPNGAATAWARPPAGRMACPRGPTTLPVWCWPHRAAARTLINIYHKINNFLFHLVKSLLVLYI